MRALILKTLLKYWSKKAYDNVYAKNLFYDIYKFLTILDIVHTPDIGPIVIHGHRSKNWISLYLACLIKGVDMLILSPNLTKVDLVGALHFTTASYLFTDDVYICGSRDMKVAIFLRGIYNLNTYESITLRGSSFNINLSAKAVNSIAEDFVTKDLLKSILRVATYSKESSIINMTSGVTHDHTKLVVSESGSIKNTVLDGIELLPFGESDVIYSEVEFAHSHILTVLIPFVKGCRFTEDQDEATTIIESTQSFERMWYDEVDYLFEYKFLNWLFNKQLFANVFKRIAKKRLQKYYDKVDHVIVYNGDLHPRCLEVAKKALPLYITYGSQETNQFLACNNVSNTSLKDSSLIGKTFGAFKLTKDGELIVSSQGVFSCYFGDDAHSNYIFKAPNTIRTGDHVTIESKNNISRFKLDGRMSNRTEKGVQLDAIEKHLRSLPYIEECVLVPWATGIAHVLVEVNQHHVEARKWGVFEIEKKLSNIIERFNKELGPQINLGEVVVSYKSLVRTFDGKVKTHLYRPYKF